MHFDRGLIWFKDLKGSYIAGIQRKNNYTVSHTIMARLSTDARCNLNSMIRIDCHEHSTRPLNNHPINNAMEVMFFVRVDYFRKKFLFLGPVTSALNFFFLNRKSTSLTLL